MSELNINKFGVKVSIDTEKESIDDIKKKLCGEDIGTVFNGVDKNNDGKVDDGAEFDTFKSNLRKAEYTIDGDEPAAHRHEEYSSSKPSSRAFNDTIQNMSRRYNSDTLKSKFKQDEADQYPVVAGDNLTKIAKKALEKEGLTVTPKALNDRMAQIASVNGLNNVNNIPIGRKLIVHLQESAVQEVKTNAAQNSAEVFGGAAPVRTVQNAPKTKAENAPQAKVNNAHQVKGGQAVTVEPSSIKIEKTLEAQGYKNNAEVTDDVKDGFEPALADGDKIEQYTMGEPEAEEEAFKLTYADGTSITAKTTDELKTKHKAYTEAKAAIKDLEEVPEVPEDGTDAEKAEAETKKAEAEAKNAQISADNAAAIRKMIELSGGDLKVIKNLLEEEYQNERLSDADRTNLVNDLLKTKNAEVVNTIINEIDAGEYIRESQSSAETVIALYQEIRAKENAGVRLTDEEIALKDVLTNKMNGDYPRLYTISADTEKGVVEKKLQYDSEGQSFYTHTDADNKVWKASTPEALDKFVAKMAEYKAETDAKKKADLKAEILSTTDPQIVKSILENRGVFGMTSEDIKGIVEKADMYVLSSLAVVANVTDGENKAIAEAVVARIETLYTSDATKGDIANARYLDKAFAWIDKLGDTTVGEGEDAVTTIPADRKQAILETYFEKTETKEGEGENETTKVTYTFKPNRKPTPEEMGGLADSIQSFYQSTPNDSQQETNAKEMVKSVFSSLTIDDMGNGRLSKVLEDKCTDIDGIFTYYGNLVLKYAELAETLETEEDALKFIEKINDKNHYIPYDKIMEKFPDSDDVKLKLMKNVSVYSSISTENLVTLLTQCMQVAEDGKVTFDRTKLPEGIELADVIKALNTYDANEENISAEEKTARETLNKYFDATLKTLGKADFDFITQLLYNNGDASKIRNRVGELVEAEFKKGDKADKEFINKVLGGNTTIIPWDKFNGHEKILAEFYCNPPEGVDNSGFKYSLMKQYDTPDKKAVLVEKYPYDSQILKDIINTAVYTTRNIDGKAKNVGEISEKLYNALKNIGAIKEMGDGQVKIYDRDDLYYIAENKDFKGKKFLSCITNKWTAEELYRNIHNQYGKENKQVQINYTQAFGEMSPKAVVDLFKEYRGIDGNKEGLLEALDFEANGASLADMMGLIQKVVAYAQEKGKSDTPQMKALLEKLQDYAEFMTDNGKEAPEGKKWPIETPDQFLSKGFTDRATKRDFSGHYGVDTIAHGISQLWGGAPSQEFDKLVEDLIKVCG